MENKSLVCMILTMGFFLLSCTKEEGEGGRASITGSVWVENYNTLNDMNDLYELRSEYPGEDEDVYVVFGNDLGYGEKVTTGPGGKFEFKYLRPGTYRVYVQSKDTDRTSLSGFMSVETTVTISKKERKDLGTLLIFN